MGHPGVGAGADVQATRQGLFLPAPNAQARERAKASARLGAQAAEYRVAGEYVRLLGGGDMFPFTMQETIVIVALSGIVVSIFMAVLGIIEMIAKRPKNS